MIGRPRLLILDEPANGLDPAGIVEIRRILRGLRDAEGISVFVSSHILSEVAQLADRIGIIHQGRLIEGIRIGELDGTARGVELEVSEPERAAALLSKSLGLNRVEPGEGGRLVVRDSGAEASEIARVVVQAGIRLRELRVVEEDLEARFLRLTGGEA
jgi:ABC-type multidrug transport system ATPase subunit